jgi:hypothetical protein
MCRDLTLSFHYTTHAGTKGDSKDVDFYFITPAPLSRVYLRVVYPSSRNLLTRRSNLLVEGRWRGGGLK